jgi:hypothetical protein
MMERQKSDRPVASRNVFVMPEFRKEPDIEKLVRAFISVAKGLAEKKAAEEKALSSGDGKGDGVP